MWKATGVLPSQRSGFCGLCGDRVDTLDLIRDQMLGLQNQIREARNKALSESSTPSWCGSVLCYGQKGHQRAFSGQLSVHCNSLSTKVCAVQDPARCCCGCKLFGSRREPARFPRSGGTGPRGGAGVEAMLDGVILRCSAEEMERRGWTWPRTGSRRGPLFDASPAGPPTNLNPSSLPHAGVGHINRSTGAQSG